MNIFPKQYGVFGNYVVDTFKAEPQTVLEKLKEIHEGNIGRIKDAKHTNITVISIDAQATKKLREGNYFQFHIEYEIRHPHEVQTWEEKMKMLFIALGDRPFTKKLQSFILENK